jgi:hypothetical protein
LKVFENRVIRRIFGSGEVVEGWRRLHNEELHNLHTLPIIIVVVVVVVIVVVVVVVIIIIIIIIITSEIRRMRWAVHITRAGE